MKYNQSRPGFEFKSRCPFPTTITITPRKLPLKFVYKSYIQCMNKKYLAFKNLQCLICHKKQTKPNQALPIFRRLILILSRLYSVSPLFSSCGDLHSVKVWIVGNEISASSGISNESAFHLTLIENIYGMSVLDVKENYSEEKGHSSHCSLLSWQIDLPVRYFF